MTSLDQIEINRAAPPGSMRYFALLYTPAEMRDAVTALFVIDAEIRESAQSVNHDVAHTRLQWWRQEIDRLVNGHAQHPATRILQASREHKQSYAKLHELLVAADMDLTRMTYNNARETRAYCSRSGGAIAELVATQLSLAAPLDAATLKTANSLGASVRAAETVRDVRQDACEGRLYLPLDILERHNTRVEDFRDRGIGANARQALREYAVRIDADLDAALAAATAPQRAYLRPLYVLAGLHKTLLAHIERRNYDIGAERIDLGPLRKSWSAWRFARLAR